MSKTKKFTALLVAAVVVSILMLSILSGCTVNEMSQKDRALASLSAVYQTVTAADFSMPETLKLESTHTDSEGGVTVSTGYYNPKQYTVFYNTTVNGDEKSVTNSWSYCTDYSGGYAAVYATERNSMVDGMMDSDNAVKTLNVSDGYTDKDYAELMWSSSYGFDIDTYLAENIAALIVSTAEATEDNVKYTSKDADFTVEVETEIAQGTRTDTATFESGTLTESGYIIEKDGKLVTEFAFEYYWNDNTQVTFPTLTDDEIISALYNNAVKDAAVAETNEIFDLVTFTTDDENVIWNENKTKVLLMTFHHYPDSYKEGSSVTINWSSWNTSVGEFVNKYADSFTKVTNKELRMKQIMGMPASSTNNYITAMWVDPAACYRPARVTDATQNSMSVTLNANETDEYKTWFGENYVSSFITGGTLYPWTGLGYTYDWGDSHNNYGLSEFLITKGTTVEVYFTKTVEEFANWAVEQATK